MTRPNNWYPPIIYRCLLNMAMDNKLAVDEVVFNLLREALSESEYGFVCDHSSVQYSKLNTKVRPFRHAKPYCVLCYTRLEKINEKRAFRGRLVTEEEYRPIETFIDRNRKERAQKAKDDFEANVNAEVETRVGGQVDKSTFVKKNDDDKGEVPSVD